MTFAVLLALQILVWIRWGRPISWVLLIGTPLLAFVPSGVIVKAKRASWMRSWAAAQGFTYVDRPSWPIPDWNFPPFSTTRARRRRIRDGVTGTVDGRPAHMFHYTWWNNNRIQFSSHYRNVFVLDLPTALPRLTLGVNIDTTTGDRVAFESADFDRDFHVYSTDQAFAHAVFTPRTIDALLELRRQSTAVMLTKFEIVDDRFVATTTLGNRPADITAVFTAMHLIVDGIPHWVWTDRRQPPTRGMRP